MNYMDGRELSERPRNRVGLESSSHQFQWLKDSSSGMSHAGGALVTALALK